MANRFKQITALAVIVLLINFPAFSQLSVTFRTENSSEQIKDGTAEAVVSGGTAPYSYKWSMQSTSLNSPVCAGMDEGKEYTVVITDALGQHLDASVTVEASSAQEKINKVFIPAVRGINAVILWDPFSTFGLFDPRIKDEQGNMLLHPNGDPVEQPIFLVVVWLMFGALFFTIFMRFVNFRGFGHAIALARGKYDNPKDKGELTHFQALATALSGTVGLGNIAGVATAVAIGGPGATFWMIIAGLFGMSSKFVECTLGVKYRKINDKGEVSGGPMYYLTEGLAKRGLGKTGKILAVIFAVMCVGGALGGGNMFQSNQSFAQFTTTLSAAGINVGHTGFIFGVIMAALVGLVIIGGIRSIARVTDKIVPLMVIIYVSFALFIIFKNISFLGEAFYQIFHGAFSADAAKGGFVGVLMWGFRRASFSNEAGVGSASIAHSASKTDRPVSEGIVSLLEPFVDTVVICTMTALVLVFTGFAHDSQGLTGAALTNAAFSSQFSWFNWVLMICVFLFAFSTMISWSYYGLKAWTYLVGEGKRKELIFKASFLFCTVVGASAGLGAVMDFSDSMILGMAFPNIIGLLILSGEVRTDMQQYFTDLKSGVIKRFK